QVYFDYTSLPRYKNSKTSEINKFKNKSYYDINIPINIDHIDIFYQHISNLHSRLPEEIKIKAEYTESNGIEIKRADNSNGKEEEEEEQEEKTQKDNELSLDVFIRKNIRISPLVSSLSTLEY